MQYAFGWGPAGVAGGGASLPCIQPPNNIHTLKFQNSPRQQLLCQIVSLRQANDSRPQVRSVEFQTRLWVPSSTESGVEKCSAHAREQIRDLVKGRQPQWEPTLKKFLVSKRHNFHTALNEGILFFWGSPFFFWGGGGSEGPHFPVGFTTTYIVLEVGHRQSVFPTHLKNLRCLQLHDDLTFLK